MLLNELLQHSAHHFPEKAAVIFGGKRYAYAEIEQHANRLAHYFIEHEVLRGDRVVIYLANCIEAVIAIFAVLKAGAVFVIVNRTTKIDKFSYILNNCQAKAVVTDKAACNSIAKISSEIPSLKTVIVCGAEELARGDVVSENVEHIFQQYPESLPENRCIDMDLAALIYTSGSTGNPKGVMLTHLNMVSAATSITQYLENDSNDIVLNTLPLSFDYGLYQALMTFKFGGTLVLEKSFLYPFATIDLLLKEKVTGFPIVPTMAAILLQMEGLEKYDFRHLRYISNTAAHLPLNHIQKLRQIFSHTKIYCMYGLTECKRVSYLPPDQIDHRPGSVGKGMPNEEVYLVDDNGQRVGPGVVGELVVRGSNVMPGYWNAPEETKKMLKQGSYHWEKVLYTGDLFRMDEDGYLYFVARKDDIIKSRGEKVSPKEIENVLYNMPEIAEVAVIGVKDDLLGEAIMAVIVPRDGSILSEKQVKQFCHAHLEDFMVPQLVEFRESLPKTASGKIRKIELI